MCESENGIYTENLTLPLLALFSEGKGITINGAIEQD
jgi:hypothetical protein